MTCRIENGVTFKQVYNTENRISSIMKLASGNCTDPNPTLAKKWDYAVVYPEPVEGMAMELEHPHSPRHLIRVECP